MRTKVFLYRILKEYDDITTNKSEGIFVSEKWRLLGLDRHIWRDEKIRNFSESVTLKQFEVSQNNFDLLLELSPLLKISVTKVTFSIDLDEEEHDELISLIRGKHIDELQEFVETQRFENMRDIDEVSFRFDDISSYHNVLFSRDAVLTVDSNEEGLTHLMSTEPIGILSGLHLPTI